MSAQPKPSKQNTQRQRRKEFSERLAAVNEKVWRRDNGRCIICGSPKIFYIVKFRSGAHHILSRGAHPEISLDIKNMCLLCVDCHNEDANTQSTVGELFKIMQERYGYDYSQIPYRYYLEDK